jgi:hypothetical protein
MPKPVPLPIHFKLPGRSYSQIGRKGNVALYSVYSDYSDDRFSSLPYVLIGFELVVIKIKNGFEIYPSAWQFGRCAWSIPKSFPRVCSACLRRCVSRFAQLRKRWLNSFPYRSTSSQVWAHLANSSPQADQTSSSSPLRGFISLTSGTIPATNTPQRRVTLLKGQI